MKKGIKFNQTLEITFIRLTTDRDELDKDADIRIDLITRKKFKVKTANFTSKPSVITNEAEIKEKVQLSVQEILKKTGQWLFERFDC